MSYLYGKRFVGPITPLILQLREELYIQPYDNINWWRARHLCAKVSSSSVTIFYRTHPLENRLIRGKCLEAYIHIVKIVHKPRRILMIVIS
jgi:hypothetical protein